MATTTRTTTTVMVGVSRRVRSAGVTANDLSPTRGGDTRARGDVATITAVGRGGLCYDDAMRRRRPLLAVAVITVAVAVLPCGARAAAVSVKSVEALEGDETVVKIHLTGPLATAPHTTFLPKGGHQPDRLAIDLPGADMHGKPARTAEVGWGGVQRIRLGTSNDAVRVVLDLDHPVGFDVAREGDVVAITLHEARGDVILQTVPEGAPPAAAPAGPAPGATMLPVPNSAGEKPVDGQ